MGDPVRVTVFPCDRWGCGSYRLLFPMEVLAAAGHDVVEGQPVSIYRDRRGEVVRVAVPETDVVVFQRPGSRTIAGAIPFFQAAGVAVVIDVDDDLESIHPGNAAFAGYHPKFSGEHNWTWVRQACEAADLVTTTTPALAERYGSHGRVVVLPNFVPARYLAIKRPRSTPPVVGWAGVVATHPGDLQVVHGALAKVLAGTKATFRAIGDPATLKVLGVEGEVTDWMPLADYPGAVASLDIGLVPLADTRFNRAKSGLKLAELASLGVAAVASPTPDNLRLAALGVGVVADKPKDWERQLRRLIGHQAWRAEVAERSREVMAGQTYEANAWRWAEAWAMARAARVAA